MPINRNTAAPNVVDDLKKSTLIPILQENIAREAYVMTDEARQYQGIGAGRVFDVHGWTNHSAGEYVNLEDREMHTNTVEGFYSIFKRGMRRALTKNRRSWQSRSRRVTKLSKKEISSGR